MAEQSQDGRSLDRFLRRSEVIEITGLKTSSIYEGIKAGTFPKPVKLNLTSKRSPVAWLQTEVRAWQEMRIAERDTKSSSHFHPGLVRGVK
jgi:prophage regulatory protein